MSDTTSIPTAMPTRYRIATLPPPGYNIAANGFPADPRPKGAPKEFLDAMDVRIKVFCDEQNCAVELELDEDDPRSWHFVAYQQNPDGSETPASVIRIVPPPHTAHPNGYEDPKEEPYVKLGRVATLKEARGKGLSRQLTKAAFSLISKKPDVISKEWTGNVLAHAQVSVEKMYERLGFVTDDKLGRWDEEGIEHLGMWKKLDLQR